MALSPISLIQECGQSSVGAKIERLAPKIEAFHLIIYSLYIMA